MSIFVDFAGMNTLVKSYGTGESGSFQSDNVIESGINNKILSIPSHQLLVGANLHRNGPYGYSSWKQLRVSENPLTRHHKETNMMTFVLQPGPIRNVSTTGELRVRDRYSSLYNYTEPAVCEKTYPLVWNVGRHFKDEDGNLSPEPQRFSIISSYGNQQLGFSNEEVNKLLNFKVDETQTEYDAIKSMYLDNGLNKQDSPLTHWEFLQYRETIFPRAQNQYIDKVRNRPQFESFFRHNREDRTKELYSDDFGWNPPSPSWEHVISQSTWTLDEHQNFIDRSYSTDRNSVRFSNGSDTLGGSSFYRNGEGILLNTTTQFHNNLVSYIGTGVGGLNNSNVISASNGATSIDYLLTPGPLYSRRISLANSQSVSNPSGMEIYGTSSTNHLFQGGALWEAGSKRYIKDENGNYVHSPKYPFYDSYDHYIEEAKKYGKNYSVVPEFRMSTQVEDYVNTSGRIELDMFDVTGGVSGNEDSSKSSFFQIYSNTDFLRSFEIIDHDHKDFTNAKVLSLRCKAIKKFLPYEGFYPAQRTVDLAKRFYDSYKNNIAIMNGNGVQLSNFNYGRQMVMTPLFAPGVLFNTIKSGVAVDYPIITGSMNVNTLSTTHLINQDFNFRVPFEAIITPDSYLKNITLTSNEPHPSGNLSASAIWDGDGDTLYKTMANNFFAEVPEFFLPNKSFTSIASKKQGDGIYLEAGKEYGMRISMNKSMDKTRIAVYHSGNLEAKYFPPQDIIKTGSEAVRETFTMYSRPSAFGPPSLGLNSWQHDNVTVDRLFHFDNDRYDTLLADGSEETFQKDSIVGYNFPFTPPYYHGQGWCDITITGEGRTYTIKEIQESASYNYSRFEYSFYGSSITGANSQDISEGNSYGPQALHKINQNAVQLSASLNIKGIGSIVSRGSGGTAGNFIVDTALDTEARWIIQTKFETPMLNFSHVSGSDHLTLPNYGSESVPRGMWHQHGRIPEEQDGIFVGVGPIDPAYQFVVMGKTPATQLIDLSEKLGFSGVKTKLGRLAPSKTIYEAVVAVPFIEENGRKKFFKLDSDKVAAYKKPEDSLIHQSLFTSSPDTQIGRSIANQMDKMKKYIFPPSFDFINYDDVTPIAMYIFEFSHVLNQQDLSDIWQNLPPSIGETMEVAEVAITHPLLKKELLGEGGSSGNATIKMPEKLKWMVFKVKQRAASNYFKKTVLRNSQVNQDVESGNVTQDEFGQTSKIQYNWPYDYFSLVEMVKIDAEIELGNIDFSNYTDKIPEWDAVQTKPEQVENVVAGLESNPIADYQVFFPPPELDLPFSPGQIESINSSYQANKQIKGKGLASMVERSMTAVQADYNLNKQDQVKAGAGLSQMISRAQQGQAAIAGGVDFSSFNNFMSSIPANVILQTGIPRDQAESIMRTAYAQVQNYNSMVSSYGVNSTQAKNALQVTLVTLQPLQGTQLINSFASSFNINTTTGLFKP